MALTSTAADAIATAICSALGVSDAAAIAKWKTVAETIYSHLKTDLSVSVSAMSITTTGSAATQTGPAAPVPCTVT